ncbi:MAG: hypothetical protein V1799_18620 [bacterium]
MKACKVLLIILAFTLMVSNLDAQVTSIVARVNVQQGTERQPVPVSVEFTQATGISQVMLRYRRFGESEFKEVEMLLAGRTATGSIPPEVVAPPYVEYYVFANLGGGKTETYPLENAEVTPMKVPVQGVNPKDLEVRILSPEKGETISFEDLAVAISLFYASDDVNKKGTRIYIDGSEVSSQAVFADDIITYAPQNFSQQLNLGLHFIKIELRDKTGAVYHSIESSFNLSTAAAIEAEVSRLHAGVDGQLEYRNENISSVKTTYTRGEMRLNGTYKSLRFGSNVNVTNEEKPERQPQNRLMGWAETDFLRLEVGDSYPRLPSLIVSGKRVRGLSASLMLGFFNVDVTYGKTVRPIEGLRLKDTTYLDASAVSSRPTNTLQIAGLKYEEFTPGSYGRDFFAVRPSFGSGENFQLGVTFMKAKDDIGSIKRGIFPQENLVAGSDLVIAFDDQRFKLEGQTSLSIVNTNIKEGSFTQAQLDSVRARDPQQAKDLEDIKKLAEQFITINENVFPSNPAGEGLPSMSYEGVLTLNYLNNYIRANLFHRGSAYLSFGNEFLQTDIEGLNVSDRIRLFQNKLLLSLSYEKKNDNTGNKKPVTTDFSTINSSATIFPAVNWPSFTVGYGTNTRKNNANISDPGQRLLVADDEISRIFVQSNYDFTLGARNNLSLSLNMADKKDKTFFKRDQTNNNISASLSSIYAIPLQTTISFTQSSNESQAMLKSLSGADSLAKAAFGYTSVAVNAQYRVLNERLRIALTAAPSFGDLKRTLVQLGLDFTVNEHHNLIFQVDYIKNSSTISTIKLEDDMITSLVYRFNF